MEIIGLILVWLALGILVGIPIGVHLRMQDERERQERVRRLHREQQR